MANIKKMKMQLLATAASVMVTAFALTSATYAWYVTNNRVEANTTNISATTNGFILQIATVAEGMYVRDGMAKEKLLLIHSRQ